MYISAGFDGHRWDDMGGLGLLEKDFAWVTKQMMQVADKHAQGRVISCLEGGYELDALARSASSHVKALLGLDG
jgi:acetoin utilization deacetylase AcuC-like enzyme